MGTKVITALVWVDTRGMLVGGLTKGAVDRFTSHLHELRRHRINHV